MLPTINKPTSGMPAKQAATVAATAIWCAFDCRQHNQWAMFFTTHLLPTDPMVTPQASSPPGRR